jgi:hypothetical protein
VIRLQLNVAGTFRDVSPGRPRRKSAPCRGRFVWKAAESEVINFSKVSKMEQQRNSGSSMLGLVYHRPGNYR